MNYLIVYTRNAGDTALLRRTLPAGYEILQAENTAQLDAWCNERPIAAMVLSKELMTPEELAARKQSGSFPVVVLGADFSEAEQTAWIRAGAADLLAVPMSEALMVRRMTNAIQLSMTLQSLRRLDGDELTGLYNRQAFFHYAQERILASPDDSFGLIVSDIDDFKMINTRYGEARGDALLSYVGHALLAQNSPDVLFARYGGDQFVGLLRKPKSADGDAGQLLAQAMAAMRADAPVDRFEVKFGFYEDVDKTLPVSVMCDRALMAVRSVKHQYGRSFARYDQRMQLQYVKEQQILECMEAALAEEQFQVYYQPKHDAATGALVGAEALVRWTNPTYGFMSPGDFIPLFERNGFITALDRYVWRRVCKDQAAWAAAGVPVVPVSANSSRKDVLDPDFLESVRSALTESGADPRWVHMEITESVYMGDAALLAPLVRAVQDMGIRIELDDFGSGFSSLGILSRIPVDVIKLDISFARGLPGQKPVIDSIIGLAHTLGCTVVAEGVETDEQLELLRQMGCDAVQGYYYSKPLPHSGFESYLKDYAGK